MVQIELSDFRRDPDKALELATDGEVVITEKGVAKYSLYAADPDEQLEEQLIQSPRFREEIERAKREIADGKGIPLKDAEW